jgi:hypothetical protein
MFADFLPRPFHPPEGGARPGRVMFVTAVALPAPRDDVFRLLADIEALPRWAPAFCERIDLNRRGWRALTAIGELCCALEADAATGAIDLRLGETPGRLELHLPLRVVALPAGCTLVSLKLVPVPGQPDRQFERERRALLAALQGLADRFKGAGSRAAGRGLPFPFDLGPCRRRAA